MDSRRVVGVWRCVFYMVRRGERKASWPNVLVCNCGCGVWLCGRSEQSCHVAFPFRSHLPGEKGLFVRLPQTVTAWQLRFHQSRQRGGRIGCLEKMYKCVSGGVPRSPPPPPILACAPLQYACECVKYENLMKPTGGARLRYVMSFVLWGAAWTSPTPSVSSHSQLSVTVEESREAEQEKEKKKYWPFCQDGIRTDNQGIKWITGWQGRLERVRDGDVKVTVMKSMVRE